MIRDSSANRERAKPCERSTALKSFARAGHLGITPGNKRNDTSPWPHRQAMALAVRNFSSRRRWSKLQEWLRPNPSLSRQIKWRVEGSKNRRKITYSPMVRRLNREKIMNKSGKDASRLGHNTFEDRTLEDAELTAVTGENQLRTAENPAEYLNQARCLTRKSYSHTPNKNPDRENKKISGTPRSRQ